MLCCGRCEVAGASSPSSVTSDVAGALSPTSTSGKKGAKGKRAVDLSNSGGGSTFTREELSESFAKFDLDSNGIIEVHEMAGLLEHLGISFTSKSLRGLFGAMDEDGGGNVCKEEFIAFFLEKDRRLGLKVIFEQVVKDKLQEERKRRAKEVLQNASRHHKNKVYTRDVYITHGMNPTAGIKRSWWLAKVLEFADFTCFGTYLQKPLENDPDKANEDSTVGADHIEGPEAGVFDVEDCECFALLLDSSSVATEDVVAELQQAKDSGAKFVCFYEGEPNVWEKLKPWRNQFPYVFQRPPVAISRHFLSDSEQLVLQAVHQMLAGDQVLLSNIRPPGGDLDDFSSLQADGIKWIKASHVAKIQRGASMKDLPKDAFGLPAQQRTCYVSYSAEDPSQPGLSPAQQSRLQEAINRNLLQDRVFFLDHVSLNGKSFFTDCDAAEILSMSRYVVVDEVQPGAKDKRPYLARGTCFLEALMAVLTGCLAPHRENQFVELDTALGIDIGCGTNLRRFFRESSARPQKLLNRLCTMFRHKFENGQDEVCAEWILRRALERHPLLVMECSVDPVPIPAAGGS